MKTINEKHQEKTVAAKTHDGEYALKNSMKNSIDYDLNLEKTE